MKNNLFTTVVSWLLAASVILSVVFFIQYAFRTRDLRRYRGELMALQNRRQVLTMVLNDVAAYSRQDPGILPIVQSLGIRVSTNAPAAPGARTGASTSAPAAK